MHTCAQTICAAFGREDLLEDMKKQSGGRADGGTCGALHAAMHLAGDDAPQIEEAFRTALGATRCRELKGGDPPVPCQLCVKTAAELLEKLFESKA